MELALSNPILRGKVNVEVTTRDLLVRLFVVRSTAVKLYLGYLVFPPAKRFKNFRTPLRCL